MHPRPRMPMTRMSRMHPMHGPQRFGPMAQGPMMRQGGGLLSKILGKGNRVNEIGFNTASKGMAGNRAIPSSGSSFLKTLSNPSSINGLLSNTQKVLNTAGQIAPMVQQYGPMVRNLPAIWKLYKGFKDIPTEETMEDVNIEKEKNLKNKEKENTTDKEDFHVHEQPKEKKGLSKPKLYV